MISYEKIFFFGKGWSKAENIDIFTGKIHGYYKYLGFVCYFFIYQNIQWILWD